MKNYIKIILIGVFFILLQSYLQNNLALTSIYERYVGYLMPIIYAIFIAIFLDPVVEFIKKKLPFKKYNMLISITITILLIIFLFIGFILLIAPQIAKSIQELYGKMPYMQKKGLFYLSKIIEYLKARGFLIFGEQELEQSVMSFVKRNMSSIQSFGVSALLNIVWWGVALSKFLIGAFLGLLIIYNRDYFITFLKNFLIAIFGKKKEVVIYDFLEKSRMILLKFVAGRMLVSFVVGLCVFIVMIVSGTPYAILTAIMMGIGNMIPYIGSIVASIIALFLVSLAVPSKIIYLFLAILVAQSVDGLVVGPKIVGETVGMNTFWIMIAILIGGNLGGITGMFFGVPVLAIIKLIYHDRLKKEIL